MKALPSIVFFYVHTAQQEKSENTKQSAHTPAHSFIRVINRRKSSSDGNVRH